MRKLFCKTKNSKQIFFDGENTNIHFHILETPDLLKLMKEALTQVEIGDKEQIVFEKDLGKIVGTTSLVKTNKNDEIVYAKRKERNEYSRFVKNKKPVPTRFVVVVLREVDGGYNLWTAMCGRLLPPEAYDLNDRKDPLGFSQNHALVFDKRLVQQETLTNICPW